MGKASAASAPSGLLLFNKQPGVTSFAALGDIKRALGTGKVGHTGTLDKFAGGLLVVLTGRALKLSPWFSHCDKQYEGVIHFGVETDTLDPEGAVAAEAPPPSREAVEAVLPQFTGNIMQAPPAYSAIHINGKRASALARSGEMPEMQKRPVCVYRLELRAWEPPLARMFVHCSSGTYIRSLARDIALAAGSRAHLTALVRTRVAGFSLEDAVAADAISGAVSAGSLPGPIDTAVFDALALPRFAVDDAEARRIVHGKPLARILDGKAPVFPAGQSEAAAAGIFHGEELAAVVQKTAAGWQYACVFGKYCPT
jgi:tRNA pseudouridine55 synthase